MNGSFAAG
ncbi:Protein of unknown function [Bacillus mobilis]|nr:Protein of unknown function [Bacillus mobilis]